MPRGQLVGCVSLLIFLLVFLFMGIAVHDNYGLSWDEQVQRDLGFKTLNYVFRSDNTVQRTEIKYYGPAFETAMAFIESVIQPTDIRDVFLFRHLCTFLLFFAGVTAFSVLCGLHFKNWWYATLGGLILVLQPRVFAHSFFNSKDLPFLSAFCLAMFSA